PGLPDLEGAIEWRGFRHEYRSASAFVHAGSDGLSPSGVPEHGVDFLLVGPSGTGLAGPGIDTSFSLVQILAALAPDPPTLEHSFNVSILAILRNDCEEAFLSAHEREQKHPTKRPRPKRRTKSARRAKAR
ncbi:MAG: hypothetical protein ACYC2K_08255, partial [Gemmatimonadales bacterium]